MVDWYRTIRCAVTDDLTAMEFIVMVNCVHCNFGWDKIVNGYYGSGVFDTINAPLPARVLNDTPHYFR